MVIQNSDNSNNNNTINETNFNKKKFWTYERFYEKGHRGGAKGISKKNKINIKSTKATNSKHSKAITKKKIIWLKI